MFLFKMFLLPPLGISRSGRPNHSPSLSYTPAEKPFVLTASNPQREIDSGLNEAVHVVTTTFQHLLWPQLGCFILENYLIVGSCTLLACKIQKQYRIWF
jgi:hypothetical protein